MVILACHNFLGACIKTRIIMYSGYRSTRRAQAVMRGAKFAYAHRRQIGTALRRARGRARAVSAYRARKHGIGERKGTSSSKKFASSDVGTGAGDRQLYATEISHLSTASSIQDKNKRWRQVAYISGWKINMEFRNNDDEPFYVNVAVLALKDGSGSFVPGTSTVDFFRGYANERSINFNDASLHGQDYYTRAINTDKFAVLTRKKFMLAPKGDTNGNYSERSGRNYRGIQMWIPFKRQLRYKDEDPNDPQAESQVFLCWWCSKFGTAANGAPYTPAGSMDVTRRIVTFFREPKLCC